MTKEELIELLKENFDLSIDVQESQWSSSFKVTVSLVVKDEVGFYSTVLESSTTFDMSSLVRNIVD